jgi:hypothetical protein
MHPILLHCEQVLAEVSRQAEAHFGPLSAEALNWKPAPEVWSVAQNLDHLMVINRSYFPLPEAIRAGQYRAPRWAAWPWAVRFFEKLIYSSVLPDRKRKMKTFPLWEPSASALPADIVSRFLAHQQELIAWMKSCEDLVAAGVVLSSPAKRVIVYRLEKAFEIIATHEQRHLAQALEALSLRVG